MESFNSWNIGFFAVAHNIYLKNISNVYCTFCLILCKCYCHHDFRGEKQLSFIKLYYQDKYGTYQSQWIFPIKLLKAPHALVIIQALVSVVIRVFGVPNSVFLCQTVFCQNCPLHFLVSTRILLEKAMAPHSSTLAWKIPWMEEPGRLLSTGSLRVGHDWATSLSLFTFMHWRRKWQPTPVFLPGESQGWGSLLGCHLWGRTESDTTEAT